LGILSLPDRYATVSVSLDLKRHALFPAKRLKPANSHENEPIVVYAALHRELNAHILFTGFLLPLIAYIKTKK
jgi:hypothetical protein